VKQEAGASLRVTDWRDRYDQASTEVDDPTSLLLETPHQRPTRTPL